MFDMKDLKNPVKSELLIGSVFLRKQLWNQTSRGYRNRVLLDNRRNSLKSSMFWKVDVTRMNDKIANVYRGQSDEKAESSAGYVW